MNNIHYFVLFKEQEEYLFWSFLSVSSELVVCRMGLEKDKYINICMSIKILYSSMG